MTQFSIEIFTSLGFSENEARQMRKEIDEGVFRLPGPIVNHKKFNNTEILTIKNSDVGYQSLMIFTDSVLPIRVYDSLRLARIGHDDIVQGITSLWSSIN